MGAWWDWAIRLVVVESVVLMVWWLWQAQGESFEETWTLFSPYNIGTVLIQWVIVLAVLIVVSNAIMNRYVIMLVGLLLFLIARSADEWIFQRGLPGDEVDRHAKTHLAFLTFLMLAVSFDHFVA